MSESTTKKLRAEVARLKECIDVHRDMELKLLYDVLDLKKEKQRLGILAIKHCPKEHHDWDDLVALTEGLFDTTDEDQTHAARLQERVRRVPRQARAKEEPGQAQRGSA